MPSIATSKGPPLFASFPCSKTVCVPSDAVSQLVSLLRSKGISVEQRNWPDPATVAQAAYSSGTAAVPTMRDAGMVSVGKITDVGTLMVPAALIIVPAFLT